jgi:LPXTG-site transpeptidase (sortase) family protein
LEGTAFPTQAGNSVLTAHVYLPNGKPGPFIDLKNLMYGDEIVIQAYGQRYVYEVRETGKITPDSASVFKHSEYPALTLVTCMGYDETSGKYLWRYTARAVQVRIEK